MNKARNTAKSCNNNVDKGTKSNTTANNYNNRRAASRRGRKGKSAGSKHEGADIGEIKIDTINDPSWYKPSDQMVKDVASLPFGYRVGTPYKDVFPHNAPTQADGYTYFPGLMTLVIAPAVGEISDATSPINVAANALYSYIRHANSGQPNGDAPDVMQYIIAMDSAYSYYVWLTRLYGTLSNYSIYNKYSPDTLLAAQRVSADDLQSNMANFRAFINQFAYKLASLCVPKEINFISRHMWLYANYYTDAETTKAQVYMYTPAGFYQFAENTPQGQPPVLNLIPLWQDPTDRLTLSDLVAYGNSLINPIIGSESMNLIAGDILKAFGTANLFKVTPIDESFHTQPVYSKEVLTQIENASVGYWTENPADGDALSFSITQDLSDLANGPRLAASYKYVTSADWDGEAAPTVDNRILAQRAERYLNFHKDEVTPDDVMVATRLMHSMSTFSSITGSEATGYKTTVTPHHFASEIVLSGTMYQPHFGGKLSYAPVSMTLSSDFSLFVDSNGFIRQAFAMYAGMISAFDWAPITYVTVHRSNNEEATAWVHAINPLMDVDNCTLVHMDVLDRLNECALLGLFSVGSMGSFTL